MISVIVYGRNDSYGYNLPKRAAISLNCIAEVLSDPDDEILFVDCNTPNEMPTFPQAIADTLTPKAKALLRIFRLRPNLYEKHKKGSPLMALEPLSRNIALRRSNPTNRWILSTNTDMVFVVRDVTKSLSEVVASLPDGLYELPRFEVPGALWESVDRHEPRKIISAFADWGQRLHLNVAVLSRPEIRFDGPGDFQLMLREQIFAIDGFNEEMVLGWHVDSNLCRRLFLLNGKTESLLDQVFAYHCDHTRQVTVLHDSALRTNNDAKQFVHGVHSPYLPDQENTWGLPNEEIEELSLSEKRRGTYDLALETLLPGMSEPIAWDSFTAESYDKSQIYDNFHMFPYLADYLIDIDRASTIGYFGANLDLVELLHRFLSNIGYRGEILVNRDLMTCAFPDRSPSLPERCKLLSTHALVDQSDIYIFDIALMHLQIPRNATDPGSLIAWRNAEEFRDTLAKDFYRTVVEERNRLSSATHLQKQFLLIGAHHTWFEGVVLKAIGTTVTPFSSHVRQGFAHHIPSSAASKRRLLPKFGRSAFIDRSGLARHYSRQGKQNFRARDYPRARRYFYRAFRHRPFDAMNLRRLLLAYLWGIRRIYIRYKTNGQDTSIKAKP